MKDFLSSRPTIVAPRKGHVSALAAATKVETNPLGALTAEVKTKTGEALEGTPEIETVMADGRIKRIHIHCKCGEEIILHCNYTV